MHVDGPISSSAAITGNSKHVTTATLLQIGPGNYHNTFRNAYLYYWHNGVRWP